MEEYFGQMYLVSSLELSSRVKPISFFFFCMKQIIHNFEFFLLCNLAK